MEDYFELVVDRLTGAGYRWYETANFCLAPERAAGRDLRSRHNLAYWLGRDYLGLGLGAVSTLEGVRRRNAPRLAAYLGALAHGRIPPREPEAVPQDVRLRERVMLGLRLDEPLSLGEVGAVIDRAALDRLERLELVRRSASGLVLTGRGRRLGMAVTAELIA
jgi:oxygen-independent coproporphyrinogen-3 oxidase